MKKLNLLILFVCFAIVPALSQDVFSFGKKYGMMSPNNINRTVYSYNYARQWLTQKMPYFGRMEGYEMSWQHMGEGLGYQASFSRIKEVNNAFGLEPTGGLNGYRKIRLSYGGLSFGLNHILTQKKHFELVPSLDFDLHFLIVTTTYSNDAAFAGASEEGVVAKLKMANTLALNFRFFVTQWFGISIRPYGQLPWGKVNVEGLAAYWGGSGTGAQRESIRNYGLSASVFLEFGRDY
jgi:hypothetical protein